MAAEDIAGQNTGLSELDRDRCFYFSAADASLGFTYAPIARLGNSIPLEARYFEDTADAEYRPPAAVRSATNEVQADMFTTGLLVSAGNSAVAAAAETHGPLRRFPRPVKGTTNGKPLSDELVAEQIAAYQEDENELVRNFGRSVVALARFAGLAKTITADSLSLLGPIIDRDLPADAADNSREFSPLGGGWGLFDTQQAGPILLQLEETAGQQPDEPSFTGVALDELFRARPDELRGLFVEYHSQRARARLIGAATSHLTWHNEEAKQAFVSGPVRRLAAIEDPEQAHTTLEAIGTYLNYLTKGASPGLDTLAWRFTDEINHTSRLNRGGPLLSTDYLTHLVNCPVEPEGSKEGAERQMEIIALFRASRADAQRFTVEDLAFSPLILEVPLQMTIRDPDSAAEWAQKGPRMRQALECMEACAEATPQQLRSVLRNDWPDQHRTLTQFSRWLNTGRPAGDRQESRLNQAIQAAATDLDQSITRGVASTRELWASIERRIGAIVSALPEGVKPFKGVTPLTSEAAMINDPDLKAILPLLVFAQARRHPQAHPPADTPRHLQHYDGLQITLTRQSRYDLLQKEKNASIVEHRLADLEEFKEQTGITDADIQAIATVAQLSHPFGKPSTIRKRSETYDAVFIALTLHRQGQIDLTSSSFQEFLREFLEEPNLDLSALNLGGDSISHTEQTA